MVTIKNLPLTLSIAINTKHAKRFAGLATILTLITSTPVLAVDLHFIDIAAERGVQVIDRVSRGAVWEDLDTDGDLDLVVGNLFSANQIFQNNGLGFFTDTSIAWGIDDTLVEDTYGVNVADINNDNQPDIFFANGGYNSKNVNRLYVNQLEAGRKFFEVGSPAGVAGVPAYNYSVAWLDFDNDGLLDMVVHNRDAQSALYHNQGDGTFVDVAAASGIDVSFFANGVCPFDYNNDGYIDIFFPSFAVQGIRKLSRLYRNNGNSTFTDVTNAAGLDRPIRAHTCGVEDFNQDGWLDLYIASWNSAFSPVKRPSHLYINKRNGTFINVAAPSGADIALNIMGFQVGDLNNDGYPEIYGGMGQPETVSEDVLLLNTTNPLTGLVRFEDISESSGIRSVAATRTHGASFADFDRDGDVDMYITMGGNVPSTLCACPIDEQTLSCGCLATDGDEEPNRLWLNDSSLTNNWFRYRLIGAVSNRDAVDARMTIHAGTQTFYQRVAGGNGFNNRNSFEMLAGVGTQTVIDDVWIRWPSGIWQVIKQPAVGESYVWHETGLSAQRKVSAGENVELSNVAVEASQYITLASQTRLPQSSAPAGEFLLGEGRRFLGAGTTDSTGIARVIFSVPLDAVSGDNFYAQSLIRVDGKLSFSNLHTMTVK
jgi:hypothetical protein